ncbi:site-specific integrase [Saccharicrinis sp. 156]|uniref:site-specific integrase n=1 Tax=Saccharicrinis sp. 156 TaxID=3417574 RepID=UPI003D330557
MKPTDFAQHVTIFLSKYLPGERGLSTHTIESYKYAFVLFVRFMKQKKNIAVTKLRLSDLTKDCVTGFLDWLGNTRGCSPATRNVRLATIHSFVRFLQYRLPEKMAQWQNILSIKEKRTGKKTISYLSVDGTKLLLEQPDTTTAKGRRDLAMLALMYDCGARVQETIDLTPSDIRLHKPHTVRLTGKGNKTRIVPLMEEEVAHVKGYMEEKGLNKVHLSEAPLFCNKRKERLTRAGINSILKKYVKDAKEKSPGLIPDNISCHSLRHSKAMHLLQAGVNIVYIRDFLGHESVLTTEIYARVDSKQKRDALEKAYVQIVEKETPVWVENDDLMQWLKRF